MLNHATQVAKCGIIDHILTFATFKNQKELKKSDGAKRARLTGRIWTTVVAILPQDTRCSSGHFPGFQDTLRKPY